MSIGDETSSKPANCASDSGCFSMFEELIRGTELERLTLACDPRPESELSDRMILVGGLLKSPTKV